MSLPSPISVLAASPQFLSHTSYPKPPSFRELRYALSVPLSPLYFSLVSPLFRCHPSYHIYNIYNILLVLGPWGLFVCLFIGQSRCAITLKDFAYLFAVIPCYSVCCPTFAHSHTYNIYNILLPTSLKLEVDGE